MDANVQDPEDWIVSFRRLGARDKNGGWKTLTPEQKKILVDRLTLNTPFLTRDQVKESSLYNLTGLNTYNRLSAHDIENLRTKGPASLIKSLKTREAGALTNLGESGITLKDTAKHFEYGVYLDFLPPNGDLTLVTAWIYGIPWWEVLGYYSQLNVEGRRHYARYSFGMDDLEFFLSSLPKLAFPAEYPGVSEGKFDVLEKILQKVLDKNLTNDAVGVLLTEFNRRGLAFDKQERHGVNVFHLNHIKLLPPWPRYIVNATGHHSDRPSKLIKYLKSPRCPLFPYPRFKKEQWQTYPAELRAQLLTVICSQRFRKSQFNFHRDLMPMLLGWVVTNFYMACQNRIEEWTILAQKYFNLTSSTLIPKAMDVLITSREHPPNCEELACRLAAFTLGYEDVIDSIDSFQRGSAGQIGKWSKIIKVIPGRRLAYDQEIALLTVIYNNKICISLVRNGKITITPLGTIENLEKAVRLSEDKRLSDKTLAERFRRSEGKPVKKKLKMTQEDDVTV